MTIKNSRFAYIAPFYKQAKAIVWDMLKYYARPIPGAKFNEAELRVDYPNGSRIQLFGADNVDALRGLGLWGVVFDEYSQQPASIFTEVIRPALSDHEGYAIWIGTPKGRNEFARLYEEHKNDPNWTVVLLKASESGLIASGELEEAKKVMSMDEYNQEFECSFDAAIKGAYYAFEIAECRKDGRIMSFPFDPNLKVNTYWDLGISDTTCIIFVQQAGREIRIIDFLESNGRSLESYAMELRKKGYNYGQHWLPHDIKVKELGTGRSRFEMLGDHLGKESLRVVPNIPIKDGIEAMRKIFPRIWFNEEKTTALLNALASYTQEWDDSKGMFRDKPLHNWASHASDSARMLAVGLREQEEPFEQRAIPSKYNMSDKSKVSKLLKSYQFRI
jgi:hypothetical protein